MGWRAWRRTIERLPSPEILPRCCVIVVSRYSCVPLRQTPKAMNEPIPPSDPVMEEALDWFLRLDTAGDRDAVERELQRWRAASPRHDAAWRRVTDMWHLAGELPPDYAEKFNKKFNKGGVRRWAVPAAATALAASLLIVLLPDIETPSREVYATGSAELAAVALEDGSTVHLDAESRVAVTLGAQHRRVDLIAGQAFFEVSHDPARPFVVSADALEITVTGTAFSVRRDSRSVSVAVQSGSVRTAAPRAASTTTASVDLEAGEMLTLPRTADSLSLAARTTIAPDDVAAWRDGLLIADGMTLAALIEEIDRHYGGEIWLSNDELGARRITGVFNLDDPRAALRAAAASQNARIEALHGDVLAVLAD